MMFIRLLSTFFLLFIDATFAKPIEACDKISNFSCSSEPTDDGTGISLREKDALKPGAVFDSFRPKLENKFRAALRSPDNIYFKKMSVATLGLKDKPFCSSTAEVDIKQCDEAIAKGLTDLAKRKTILSKDIENAQEVQDLEALSYLIKNHTFVTNLEEVEKAIDKKFFPLKNDAKVKNRIFPKVKKDLIKRINLLPIDDKSKMLMREKVQGVQFSGSDCSERDTGLNKTFFQNAFYDPDGNTFKLCSGLLIENTSEFTIASIIAHELAHSIDPCHLTDGPAGFKYKNTEDLNRMDADYPVTGLISCLRLNKSVGAVNFGVKAAAARKESALLSVGGKPITKEDLAESKKIRYSYCGGRDQITEAVADWFSAEVLKDYIQSEYPNLSQEQWRIGVANAFKPGCGEKAHDDNEHSAIEIRMDRIFLQSPGLRSMMGCQHQKSKYLYCDAQNPESLLQMKDIEQSGNKAQRPATGTANSKVNGGNR